MASLNKVQIIGALGRDPEIIKTNSGATICKFSVATSEKWKDKNTGEFKEHVEWHKITIFGKIAENCGKYLAKGSRVYVEGRLQTSSYEKDGITRYNTDIIASDVQFLSHAKKAEPGQRQTVKNDGYSDWGSGPDDMKDMDIPF